MEESILNFAQQFNFEPEIENKEKLKEANGFVVGGMGGSNQATDILKSVHPELDIIVHRDYGLPEISEDKLNEKLFIASSFSGNTEEALDFAKGALEKKLNLAVVTKGGELLEFAEKEQLPFIKIPYTDMQPRMAIGFSTVAFAKLMDPHLISDLHQLSRSLNPTNFKEEGERLADFAENKVPIIYPSTKNKVVGRIWKIKLNETGKIPAFFNFFPELNHNEMTSFDHVEKNQNLSEKFCFIFVKDKTDHERIQKRMEVTEKILSDKNLKVETVNLSGNNKIEEIFNALLLADWMSLFTAKKYGVEPDQVPMVEKLKELIK
jgi:glucose/mannose-6-phosphate isomerase